MLQPGSTQPQSSPSSYHRTQCETNSSTAWPDRGLLTGMSLYWGCTDLRTYKLLFAPRSWERCISTMSRTSFKAVIQGQSEDFCHVNTWKQTPHLSTELRWFFARGISKLGMNRSRFISSLKWCYFGKKCKMLAGKWSTTKGQLIKGSCSLGSIPIANEK